MRALMGLIKVRHGTYYAQQRVAERLQEAIARVLKLDKPRLVFLKRSLGTKVTKDANTRARPFSKATTFNLCTFASCNL